MDRTTELSKAAESWGATFGIAGALLLALAIPASAWGWIFFLLSNGAWLVFSAALRFRRLFVQTCVFTATSLLGIANSFYPANPLRSAMTAWLG